MLRNSSLTVSLVMPTYNAEKYLAKSLDSIFRQNYPSDKFEVIIADGGSTDSTIDIAKKYDVKVVSNVRKTAEYGKFEAYNASSGDYILLIDSDNVIKSESLLTEMVAALDNKNIDCVESNYFVAKDFNSLNTYISLLVIADPLARMLANRPYKLTTHENIILKRFKKGTIPVGGANGFMWRRKMLANYLGDNKELNEMRLMTSIGADKDLLIANIPTAGIYHYYCTGFTDLIKKRIKIAKKHLQRRENEITWVQKRNPVILILSVVYLATFVGPSIEAIVMLIKTRRLEWLWHPLISFLVIGIYCTYIVNYRFQKLAKKVM